MPRVINRTRAPVAMVIFVAMVVVAAFGVINILTAALAAAFLMVLTGCLSMHEAYKAIDVPVLVLIIGTIALGAAMTVCGAADLYAQGFLGLFHGAGPHAVLVAFIVLTSLLSHVLSNNSTAVLLVPIGMATAAALGGRPAALRRGHLLRGLGLLRHAHRLPDQPSGLRSWWLPIHRLPAPRHGTQRGRLGDGCLARTAILVILSRASRATTVLNFTIHLQWKTDTTSRWNH